MNDPTPLTAAEHEDRQGPPDTLASDGPGTEPAHTLLRTAATCRPLEEVTALVSLLKESGQLPNPGLEALRTAAVTRPVHEVQRMVALLAEPPHEVDEADATLRAAAVGRPIADVALLVSHFSAGEPAGPDASPTAEAVAQGAPPSAGPGAEPYPAAPGAPHRELYAPAPPARPQHAAAPGRAAPAATGPVTGAARGPSAGSQALRHVLRWPVALALLVSGALHLPQDLTVPPATDAVGLLPLLATVLCLGLGALLALWDTTAVWRAAAATAVGVVALHVWGGAAHVDPLGGAVGASVAWAGVVAVMCAAGGAVLAGMALRTGARPRQGEAA
ncbi:hypothetical protein [Streptomyces sp. cmx-4-9]|uniref:hypothetical protein n=1 Tax=Streptomyces sp. cmx-4-9 TaxID=2790941 RepID=UPI00397F3BD4